MREKWPATTSAIMRSGGVAMSSVKIFSRGVITSDTRRVAEVEDLVDQFALLRLDFALKLAGLKQRLEFLLRDRLRAAAAAAQA